jgi:hypothetical protein
MHVLIPQQEIRIPRKSTIPPVVADFVDRLTDDEVLDLIDPLPNVPSVPWVIRIGGAWALRFLDWMEHNGGNDAT